MNVDCHFSDIVYESPSLGESSERISDKQMARMEYAPDTE